MISQLLLSAYHVLYPILNSLYVYNLLNTEVLRVDTIILHVLQMKKMGHQGIRPGFNVKVRPLLLPHYTLLPP